jgi:hypothetical protein
LSLKVNILSFTNIGKDLTPLWKKWVLWSIKFREMIMRMKSEELMLQGWKRDSFEQEKVMVKPTFSSFKLEVHF